VLLVFAARKTNPRAMTFGVLATFAATLLALFGGAAISWLARMRSNGVNWVAHPTPSVMALWLIGIAAAICAAALVRKGVVCTTPERAMLLGAALVWHAIAFVLAITLTGASFLFLVPAIAVTLCALARANETTISAIATTAAAIVLFPIVILLYDALGGRLMTAIAILIGILFTLIAPLFARFRYAAIAAVLAVICAVIAATLPPASHERPRAIPLAYVDDATLTPVWITPVLTPSLAQAARFAPASASLTPWYGGKQWSAPAPRMPIPRVEVSATRSGERVMIVVRSPRHANRLTLITRGGTIARVNGVPPAPRPARWRATDDVWRFALASGVDEMTVELIAPAPVDLIASDLSFGLPAPALTHARDASMAMPQHDGDVVITRARMRK